MKKVTIYLIVCLTFAFGSLIPISRPCIYACKIGYHCQNGFCVKTVTSPSDKCSLILCKAGTTCKKGKCIAIANYCTLDEECSQTQICVSNSCIDKCAAMRCSSGYSCLNGQCRPNKSQNPSQFSLCPSDSQYSLNSCKNPRPNKSTCPTLYYFRKPDPAICGIKVDGQRVNFVRECEACMDINIKYFLNASCQLAPQICNSGETCTDNLCSSA